MLIQIEPYSPELFAEIGPLGQKCWAESTEQKLATCAYYGDREFAVEPDEETYKNLAAQGRLIITTMRDEKLVGYIVGFIYGSWHHKRVRCGCGDSIYVEPDYRGYTLVMINKFMAEMKRLEVKILGWPVTQDGPVYKLLKAIGFVADDVVMEKRLCV